MSILAHLLTFLRRDNLLEVRWVSSWAEQEAPGSNTGLWTWCPSSGEQRLHDHPHPIRAMEGAGQNIGGAVCSFGRPLPWRTLLPFSRAERSPLRRCAVFRCRTRLDCHHLVAPTR